MIGAGNEDTYGEDVDPNVDYSLYGGYEDVQVPKWFEHGSVTESRINSIQSITCTAFDPFQEVLWTGLQTGRCVSYLMPTMEKYTAFNACVGEMRQVTIDQEGVIALNETELRCYSRGGLFQLSIPSQISPSLRNVMNCMTWLNMGTGTILVGGDGGLSMLDVTAGGRLLRDIPLNGNITTLRRSRAVWCGYSHGAVANLDPRTLRTEYSIDVHSGSLIDCDAKGDLLVTCGCTARKGQLYVEPIVKVYDVRTRTLITNVTVPTGNPCLLRFHPNFSSTLVIACQTGGFQLCDVAGDNPGSDMYFQIDMGEDLLTSFDISSTGEAMVFGDSGGYVHVWADRTDLRVNMYSTAPEMPDPIPSHSGRISDETSFSNLSLINMGINPNSSEALLSDWPPSLLYNVGLPPKPIDPALLAQTRVLDFVGFIANPGYIRYQIRNQHIGTGYLKAQPGKPGWVHTLAPVSVRPPKQFRWVEIKYSKLGVDDFNFGRYNPTIFAGLENSLPNSYCNSCLQVLYFNPHLRINLLNHLCNKDFCLSCELGFLFHMLDKARGTSVPNVQASNFLRAFRQIPQAAALGLFQAPELSDTPLSQLIEGFNRFLLEQVNKELASTPPMTLSAPSPSTPPTPVDMIFGSTTTTTTRCQSCGHVHERTARAFQFELVYPVPPNTTIAAPPAPLGATPRPLLHSSPFTAAVTASLCREISTKAWCEKCCQYNPSIQRKTPSSLPHILCLASGAARTSADLWRAPVPQRIVIRLAPLASDHAHAAVVVGEHSENDTLGELDDLYELTAVISHISDPSKKSPKSGHIVAQVRVPTSELPEGEKQNWHLFNDFRISPSNLEEVVNFDISWKTCCVLYYKRVDMETRIPMPIYQNPITFDVFFAKSPGKLGKPTPKEIEPITRNDEFQKGDLVAIDAEFVSLGAEESELRSDGTKVIINPAHYGLARVSVVTGYPPKPGTPFIDDYIVTPEPITDYLTRFSGIEIGDLDPNVSTKPLTTLKAVYLKLRYLVDRGVKLVGHGLTKDFRIINIVVPPDQVIDTVELFHIPRQRKISLKFLAAFLLNLEVQTGMHNSIEDARTALALYRAYRNLIDTGQFEATLNQVYHIGRLTNWSPESIHMAMKNEEYGRKT